MTYYHDNQFEIILFLSIFSRLCEVTEPSYSMQNRHTFSTLAIIRTNKKNSAGLVPIYVRITIDGKSVELSSKIYILPTLWLKGKGKVKGNTEEVRTINHSIKVLELKAKEAYHSLLEKGKPLTALAIKNYILGIEGKRHSLLTIFESHTNEIQAKIDIDFAEATYKKYKTTLKYLRNFVKAYYSVEDILLKDLNHLFITDFELYLKTQCACHQNGVLKHMQRLRKVIYIALKNDWLEKDPFIRYSIKKAPSNREYLTSEEMQAIEEKEFKIERLQIVKDLFLFTCYTGLAFSDMQSLTENNLRKGIDGEMWIFTERKKTNKPSNIPLLPQAKAILDKYQNHVVSKNKYKLLPVPSNQKLNAYLKEIADLCGITKNLTVHMGRHTFATTITLSNNVPIETVSKMLGHSDLRTTQIYAKVVEKKVSEDMKALKEKMTLAQQIMKKASGD